MATRKSEEDYTIVVKLHGLVREADEATALVKAAAHQQGLSIMCLRPYWDRGLMARTYGLWRETDV